jgi:hypothetical protein
MSGPRYYSGREIAKEIYKAAPLGMKIMMRLADGVILCLLGLILANLLPIEYIEKTQHVLIGIFITLLTIFFIVNALGIINIKLSHKLWPDDWDD